MASSLAMEGTLQHLRNLFRDGTAVGLGDGQLLARYADTRDEAAFEALIARHGPMVLATCRAVLEHEHDVEDAFQATFLVLAKNARSIRAADALGGWLHRVAYRVSVQARIEARQRRRREVEASATAAHQAHANGLEPDVVSIVHDEVDRLPEKHRWPVVLCDLEGLTYEQAAGQLRWTVPTLRCRLARARQQLRDRLDRRGITTGALGVVLAGTTTGARATVPAAMARAAVVAATGGTTSATAAALTTTLIRGMTIIRLKLTAAGVLAAVAIVAAGGLVLAVGAGRSDQPGPAMKAPVAARNPPVAAREDDAAPGAVIEVRGRVVGPDGRPVPGATLRIAYVDPADPTEATSGPDGRFLMRVPRSVLSTPAVLNGYDEFPGLVATAPGFGPGSAQGILEPGERTVRLTEDGLPIEGRIVDLEGRPIAGARVETMQLCFTPAGADLVEWFAPDQERRSARRLRDLESLPVTITAASTGRDGRFRLSGTGRNRVARLSVSGPTIATAEVYATNRDGADVRLHDEPRRPGAFLAIHPRRFEFAAAPTKPLEGVVRDKNTGQPIAGLTLHAAVYEPGAAAPVGGIGALTDAQGRYRLVGLPKASAYHLAVEQAEGKPYPRTSFRVNAKSPAFEPVPFDIALKRGILVRGRVMDQATGQPAPGYITAFVFRDNPAIKEFPGYDVYNNLASSFIKADGHYEAVGLPGRNVIACRSEMRRYRGAVGAEAIRGYDPRRMALDTVPLNCYVNNYHVLAEIDIDPRAESATLDLQLDPGRSLTIHVVGPEGRPLGGTKVKGVTDLFWDAIEYEQPSPTIEIHALDPSKPRRVLITHVGRKLIGAAYLKRDEGGPLSIRLQPWGVITGRLVDDGEPRRELALNNLGGIYPPPPADRGILPGDVRTNSAGRFRIDRLVPGLKYGASARQGSMGLGDVFRDVTVAPGEVKDLGDLKVIPHR